MENSRHLSDEASQNEYFEEEFLQEDSGSKQESVVQQSKEFLSNIIPNALNNKSNSEHELKIDHSKEAKSTTIKIEKKDVEKSTEEIKPAELFSATRERIATESEVDLDRRREVKDVGTASEEAGEVPASYYATPISEVVSSLEIGNRKISFKSGGTKKPKARSISSIVNKYKAIAIGFLVGVASLIVVIIVSS